MCPILVVLAHIFGHRLVVELGALREHREDRPEKGRDTHPIPGALVVERLDAELVSDERQSTPSFVVHHERPESLQVGEDGAAPLAPGMQ